MAPPVFPTLPGITYPVKRTPVWDTVKQDALSGKRTRYPLYTYPIYRYELPFSFLRSDSVNLEWQTLAGFINSVQGAAQLWAYNDPNDSSVTLQLFGAGDGTSVNFQLVRTLGGFTEPVFLINGSPSIYVASALKTLNTDYTINAYGVVTFTVPPAGGASLQWTGSYYFGCRFDDDVTDFSQFVQLIWELKALKFSSEKLP
jgi:hypothetical protein